LPTPQYYPNLTIRMSECEALLRLAEPVKNALFPIVRMQAWPHPKKGEGGPIVRSADHIEEAFGDRALGMDLASPFFNEQKLYKTQARKEWAALGFAEMQALHNPMDGFDAWCRFIEEDPRRIPVIQWSSDADAVRLQVERLAKLDRGIILRFRRTRGWNLSEAAALTAIPLGKTPILMVYDYEQIKASDDLTAIGIPAQGAILSANSIVIGGLRDHVFVASSWPAEFKSSGEEYARLFIKERQLFDLLRSSPPLVQAGIKLAYGDHAAVYVSERDQAFKGVPRVDYPSPGDWIYHRRREGFQKAAEMVRADPKWDDTNNCWGAHRIREAASGQMEGLGAPGRWTTIRVHLHMHVQAQSAGAPLTTDEPWSD